MSNESKDYEFDKRRHIFSQLDRDGGLPDGWYKNVIPNMVDELVDVLGPYAFDFEVLQCKEKYGAIRIYWTWAEGSYRNPEADWNEMRDKIDNILHKYEATSFLTCVECGANATNYSTGWVLPYCHECFSSK